MHFNIWPRCIWSSNEPIYVLLCVYACYYVYMRVWWVCIGLERHGKRNYRYNNCCKWIESYCTIYIIYVYIVIIQTSDCSFMPFGCNWKIRPGSSSQFFFCWNCHDTLCVWYKICIGNLLPAKERYGYSRGHCNARLSLWRRCMTHVITGKRMGTVCTIIYVFILYYIRTYRSKPVCLCNKYDLTTKLYAFCANINVRWVDTQIESTV